MTLPTTRTFTNDLPKSLPIEPRPPVANYHYSDISGLF